MKRKAYAKRLSSLFKASSKHPEVSARKLVLLAKKIQKFSESETSAKDAQICLGFAADILSENGLHKSAEKLHDEFVESCRKDMYFISFRMANELAAAAMNCFKRGKISKAQQLAFQALELFGKISESSPLISQLGNELEKYVRKAP